jgi:hypothetical protein
MPDPEGESGASVEMSVTVFQFAWCNMLEDLNIQNILMGHGPHSS